MKKGREIALTGILVLILNLAVISFLFFQVQEQRSAYRTLRSEDGFILLESLAHLIQGSLRQDNHEGQAVPESTLSHLTHLCQYKDVEYLSLETHSKIIFRSSQKPLEGQLRPIWEDSEIMASLYEGEPFSRDSEINGDTLLEFNWPLFDDQVFWGMLRLGLSMDFVRVLESNLNQNMVIFLIFVVLLDGLVFYALFLYKRLGWEELKLQTILDHIQDGVHIFRGNESIYANQPFKSICGPDWQNLHNSLERDYQTREIDGRLVLLLRNQLDQASILISKDITLENIAEETRVRERRMLSMGDLSSAFAHEVRNPLNTISMLIQQTMLSKIQKDPELEATLKIISGEINRLNQTVKEFINISKLPQLHATPEPVQAFLQEIAAFYSARMENQGVNLEIQTYDEMGNINIDKDKMKGVFINLIENALDAHSEKVAISVSRENQMFRIQVEDDGKGMDSVTRERAFELYYTTKSHGSGLGLPHVQRIMSAHGGFIKLNSSPGKGTQVTVYLPAEQRKEP